MENKVIGFREDGDLVQYADDTYSFTRIDENSSTGVWEDDFIEVITPNNSTSKIISFTKDAQRVATYIWDDAFGMPIENYINDITTKIYGKLK